MPAVLLAGGGAALVIAYDVDLLTALGTAFLATILVYVAMAVYGELTLS